MNNERTMTMTLAAVAAGGIMFGGTYAALAAGTEPVYQSSITIGNQNDGESGEAASLVSMAKIDATAATAAALAQVPGTVLKVALDNENGNLVYSVEIKTAANALQDVKVDAGNAKVLSVDTGSEIAGNDEGGSNEGGAEEGNVENGQ
ncbi:MAG: PepSY domain-containing protein [Rhizobiales bacterium]|nr:PepSY domain-containing protein [Hyphomicrobiales bacterium]MBI3674151.1 PepSY domain-containing protein [Hyphomicrobiales bacterium]